MSTPAGDRPPVRLIQAPYDSGHLGVRMGAGPRALAAAGAADRLRQRGHRVVEQVVEPSSDWRAELTTAFKLQRLVAEAVAEARAAGEVPLLLTGNCNTTLGVVAGVGGRVGLLWLDAHGDFNTPTPIRRGSSTARAWRWWLAGAGGRSRRGCRGSCRWTSATSSWSVRATSARRRSRCWSSRH